MEEKIKGEDTVRELYSLQQEEEQQQQGTSAAAAILTYTVIRPGGLTEEPARGVSALELNQGDLKSGRISRFDVARVCIESTSYPKLTGKTTFECYDGDTGKPLASVGMSNILKQKSSDRSAAAATETFVSGKERRGETF